MSQHDEQIAVAQRHVADGRRIVEWQRLRVASGKGNAAEARKLLAVFEESQSIFEDDLAHLLEEKIVYGSTSSRAVSPKAGKAASTAARDMSELK
jgi:hypothetical protein